MLQNGAHPHTQTLYLVYMQSLIKITLYRPRRFNAAAMLVTDKLHNVGTW